MSSWDYRVVEYHAPGIDYWYEIKEIYYNDEGEIEAWCPADAPTGDTLEELAEDLSAMAFATRRPTLKATDLQDGDSVIMSPLRVRRLLTDRA